MANRPTVKDVAREAGVSVTTVDRALNGRMTVREDTLKRIADAAHRVGYHNKFNLTQRLHTYSPLMRLGVVLVKRHQEFYRNFSSELEATMAQRQDIRGEVKIRYAASQAPDDFAREIMSLSEEVDAIACVSVNHRKIDEVARDLQQRGIPLFALLNDAARGIRTTYMGLNNMKVGRSAAWLLSRTIRSPGKLAVFVGGNRWHGHDLREVGFRSFIRAEAPEFTVLDTLVNLETRQVTYEATLDLLNRHTDLVGIFVAGGGMEGAIAALRESRPPNKVYTVVNELTGESRSALAEGYVHMVNATPIQALCSDLVSLVVQSLDPKGTALPDHKFYAPTVFLPEMV